LEGTCSASSLHRAAKAFIGRYALLRMKRALLALALGIGAVPALAGAVSRAVPPHAGVADVPATGAQTSLPSRPTGAVEFALVPPRGEKAPDAVEVSFESAPGSSERDRISHADAACHRSPKGWRCTLPSGALDVRIAPSGFIPRYFASVHVQAGGTAELGSIPLVRGSSVVGRAETSTGAPVGPACRAALYLNASQAGPSRGHPTGEPTLSAKVERSGFFSFRGVPPGSYAVTVSQPGSAETTVTPVIVEKDRETKIDKPLVLAPPLRLQVDLDPALDPWQQPWRVALRKRDVVIGQFRDAAGGRARGGRFLRDDLDPGSYMLDVLDSRGGAFLSENFDLSSNLELYRTIPLVPVEGSVVKGDEPFATRLQFIGAGSRSTAIRMVSDEKGVFTGLLPREGKWRVTLEDLHKTLNHVVVKRAEGARAARVRIEIPANRVTGEVVDENSEPVEGAVVTAVDLESGAPEPATTDAQGAFALEGLASAPHLLSAEAEARGRRLTSDAVRISLGKENPSANVRLVLHEQAPVDGIVSSATGPVLGAHIIAIPKGQLGIATSEADTDSQGRFHLDIPAAVGDLQLLVTPPGYALRTLRLSSPFPKPVSIAVDDNGGSIVLRTPAVDLADPAAAKPLIVADGQPLLWSFLLSWARAAGQAQQEPSRYVVPRLAPGEYAACIVTMQEQIPILLGVAALTGKGCTHGTLAPHGELMLDLSKAAD